MSTSQPVPDPIHPALGGPRPPGPGASPPAPSAATAAAAARRGLLPPPIAGQHADVAFLGALRHQAHRMGGVLHHSHEAALRIYLSNKAGRAQFDIAPKRPRILLPPDATRFEAMTELARLRHYHDVGRDEYRTMPSLRRAQGDYDRLIMDPSWTTFSGPERAHAANVMLNLGGRVERPDSPERTRSAQDPSSSTGGHHDQ